MIERCEVIEIAIKHGYDLKKESFKANSFSFHNKRTGAIVSIYNGLTTIVATTVNHPQKGRCQLTRKDVPKSLLEEIFANPRLHTGKGYHSKKELKYRCFNG